jgi:hypothetical protein
VVRAWLVVALCGCGRFAFDPLPPPGGGGDGGGGDTPDAPDVGFFMSPGGSDSNPGTRAQPWLTFAHAVPLLQPGGVLNLLMGGYDAKGATGPLHVDCTAGAANGTASAPIIVRADVPRLAHLSNATSPIIIDTCAFWEIDGLWVEGVDDAANKIGPVVEVTTSTDIVLRGLLVQRPNRLNNNNAVEVGHSMRVLVEDTEIYDFFLAGLVSFDSSAVTFRRVYVNGRGEADAAGGYVSLCPGGDQGVMSYFARGGVFEDLIAENACATTFAIYAGASASGNTGVGDNHLFIDDIALNTGTSIGMQITSNCTSTSPCATPDAIASNNRVENSVVVGFPTGIYLDGVQNTLDHVSALGTTAAGGSFTLNVQPPADPGLSASATLVAVLGVGGQNGVLEANQASWSVDHSNSNAITPYSPNDSHVTNSTMIDPALGACEVYIPATSTVATAGPGGTPIGADIRFQTQDGVMTATPFWNPDGSWAGCGPIVAGVNDDPSTSCSGVGHRLNVGVAGCPAP